uniref:F-box only protein 9 n=1 Tax=Ascaris suum TaxID=6253 RepID=F1KY64_ASCSU
MCDAVQRYMAAVRLVPDIELKLFKNRHSASSSNARSPDPRGHRRSRSRSAAVAGFEEDDDLEGTFQRRIAQRGSIIEADNCGAICPFSLLPAELLMTIVKYVVGGELDVRCLEMLSMTSTGFYLLSRDEELWRTICRRVFGEHRLTPQDNSVYACWRQMYICRPHVYLHGVYIGKCTYIRHGEASFQDKFYRPWHIVVYYRFMKFFADGTAIMVTSPENPAQIVPQLKSKSTRLGGVLFGRYWPIGQDRIAVQFCRRCEKSDQRPRRCQRLRQHFIPHEVSLQEFNMELRFGDGKKRSAHCVLQWEKYDCCFQYLQRSNLSEQS